jgi:hypothetical protein
MFSRRFVGNAMSFDGLDSFLLFGSGFVCSLSGAAEINSHLESHETTTKRRTQKIAITQNNSTKPLWLIGCEQKRLHLC